jgi:NitT/TauT family transport system substrate-binding protein
MRDLHGKAVSFSRPGSSSNLVLLKLLKDAGIDDARLIAIGPAPSGYPDILSAQLDASWGTPPTVVNELLSGEIRVIAHGNDAPEVRNATRRVNAVNAKFLAAHRSVVIGFLKAYKKSVDWAFSGEAPIAAYAKLGDQSIDAAKYIVKDFSLPSANQIDEIRGEDGVLEDAVTTQRIPHALSHDDVKGVYDLVLTQAR